MRVGGFCESRQPLPPFEAPVPQELSVRAPGWGRFSRSRHVSQRFAALRKGGAFATSGGTGLYAIRTA